MLVLRAPEDLPSDAPRPWIFLSGPIDRRVFRSAWRKKVIRGLSDIRGTLIDPTRPDWTARWETHEHAEPFRTQALWELTMLDQADRILACFTSGSAAPVSLFEFGLVARSGKTQVVCARDYRHAGHVRLACEAFNIPLWDDIDAWLEHARARFGSTR